jgi:hypothetical protein
VVGSFTHLSLGCIALGSAARVGSPPRVLVDPHLYLQIDGGERTFTLLCLCGYWLAIGVFEKVTIASHFPGHTHEVVDAMFSELRRALAAQSHAGTLSWDEIVKIAHLTFRSDTAAKHGPVRVVEADCIFDLDKFFAGVRNPELKGLWGDRLKKQIEKPHVYEMCVVVVDNVRVPEVRSYTTASNKNDDTLIKGWTRVFAKSATLPQPTNIPTADFYSAFERSRSEMVRIMQSSTPGSLGLSDTQIQHYVNLKLAPLVVDAMPFGIVALPPCAVEMVVPPVSQAAGTRQMRKETRPAAASSRGRKRKDECSDEDGDEHREEEEEEEEEENNDDEEEDEEEDNRTIVHLVELGGNGRVLVQYTNGSRKTVHRDELPDELEIEYRKLLKKKQDSTRATEKAVRYANWQASPGQPARGTKKK